MLLAKFYLSLSVPTSFALSLTHASNIFSLPHIFSLSLKKIEQERQEKERERDIKQTNRHLSLFPRQLLALFTHAILLFFSHARSLAVPVKNHFDVFSLHAPHSTQINEIDQKTKLVNYQGENTSSNSGLMTKKDVSERLAVAPSQSAIIVVMPESGSW